MKPYLIYGLLQRRECLLPTWRGLFLFLILFVVFCVIAALNVQPFLALTEPVPAEVLVVEGWVSDHVLEQTIAEFERGHYSRLYVTGGPIEKGGMLSEYKTFAELGAAILVKMGVNSSVVEAVPAPSVRRDRTYVSALALKDRLQQQMTGVTGINLVSVGVHARRSHLLFQKVFKNDLRVGIIAIEDRNYVNERWWKYSDGVRAVIDEFFAYIYALIIFPFVEP
jgi:hypothetical protein